jgi:hypothetical protein
MYEIVRLIGALLLLLVAAAPASAQTPIPEGPNNAPAFIGGPATPNPIPAPPPPQHPFMAPNGSSNLHEDAWQTDTTRRSGPLGRDPQRLSTFFSRDCASVTFNSKGRLVTVCVGLDRPQLVVMDPKTLETIETLDLPPRDPMTGGNPFTGFAGGGYFYLGHDDRAVIPTTSRHVYVINTAETPTIEQDFDLTGHVASGDGIISALPDWDGRLWFASRKGVLGTIDRASGSAKSITLEPIGNSFAVGETGSVYVVTDAAMYRFDAAADGTPQPRWRQTYENTGVQKPGQSQAGSGTTPTLMARGLVAITDNADPMNIVVYTREGRRVCSVPVFEKGASNTDQSLIAAGRSIITENNYGYSGPAATENGKTTTPGLERVDVDANLRGCHKVWHSDEVAPSVVPKVSLTSGLVYTYTKPAGDEDAWYLTALDFRDGHTVFKALAGEGLGFNNNYAPVTIGPDGTAYVGVLGGLVAVRDAVPPPQPSGAPQPQLRLRAKCRRHRLRLRVAGRDTDWIAAKKIRRRGRRATARVTITDGRVIVLRKKHLRRCR